MAFCSDEEDGVASLRNRFPKAGLTPKTTPTIIRVIDFFENGFKNCRPLEDGSRQMESLSRTNLYEA